MLKKVLFAPIIFFSCILLSFAILDFSDRNFVSGADVRRILQIDLIDYQSNFPIALNCIESYATHIHPVNLPKLLILVENKSMKKSTSALKSMCGSSNPLRCRTLFCC